LDPVRYIGNYSSGKMGFALAEACAARGADVTLISGPVNLLTKQSSIRRINVESADRMYQEAIAIFPSVDVAILCAAVADYKPATFSENKIKRKEGEQVVVALTPNPDIASALGKMKKKGQIIAGFALETSDEERNASGKLKKKNLDFIVLNSMNDAGAGFGTDTNKITILFPDNSKRVFPLKSKVEVANDIINEIEQLLI
jgi:phosphopantothenoylcysteine decarboxylase/phosphopantothenate--cysteine ligase